MAKFISICFRDSKVRPSDFNLTLNKLVEKLIPDNLISCPSKILQDETCFTILINPTSILKTERLSACVGVMINNIEDWHKVDGPIPDGNYALIRVNEEKVELASDATGTRSIWFYKDENVFVASTSQRAIISLIGSYEPNKETYPWFLSGGFHGPRMGWDHRIKYVRSNHSRVILNRQSWEITEKNETVQFSYNSPRKEKDSYYIDLFTNSFKKLNLELKDWVLPLSGGYDSRVILFLLQKSVKLKAITWGHPKSEKNPLSDTVIAKKIAKKGGASHQFYPIVPDSNIPKVFKRFLVAGEGRIDSIAGYVDGFKIWKQLCDQKALGFFRGDLPFSQGAAPSSMDMVWAQVDRPLLANDFPEELAQKWGYIHSYQTLEDEFKKREDESLTEYRDRMYIFYRTPSYIAAQNDLKSLFSEPLGPYLTRDLMDVYKSLPDHLRFNKMIVKRLAKKYSGGIPTASIDSSLSYKSYFRRPEVKSFLKDYLQTSVNNSILPMSFIQFLIDKMDSEDGKTPFHRQGNLNIWKKKLKKIVPSFILKKRKKRKGPDIFRLAFRTCIILEMDRILEEDSQFLVNAPLFSNHKKLSHY